MTHRRPSRRRARAKSPSRRKTRRHKRLPQRAWLGPPQWNYITYGILAFAIYVGTSGIYQLWQKPTELVSLLAVQRQKTLQQTWNDYREYFLRYEVEFLTAEFLAGLAHAESGGRRFASPEWDYSLSRGILGLYGPPTSAVGLMQFTAGTFEQASQWCIDDHKLKRAGVWLDPMGNCWFNWLRTRLSAEDSIHSAAAYLFAQVNRLERMFLGQPWTDKKRQQTAAILHLCGKERARQFVLEGFSSDSIPSCGSHSPSRYLARIMGYQQKIIF